MLFRWRVFRLWAALIVVAVISGAPLAVRSAGEPFEIPAILSLTGFAGFPGSEQARALGALEALVNKRGGIKGRPIHFHVYDDQSNPQISVQLAVPLIAQHVAAIVGPDLVANCRAVAPLLTNGPVAYCTSPGTPVTRDGYLFAGSTPNPFTIRASLRYFRQQGWTKIALLTPVDATGQDGEKVLLETLALPENGAVQLVANEHYAPTDLSVAAQIVRIKHTDAQALIVWATGTAFATALRGAVDNGLDIPIETSSANTTRTQLDQLKDLMPKDGLLFPGPLFYVPRKALPTNSTRSAVDDFFRGLGDAGIDPVSVDILSWDPGLIVIDALQHLGIDATAAQVHDYLEKLHDFAGVNGPYDFRDGSQRGLGLSAAVIVKWDPARRIFQAASGPGGAPLR